MRITILKSCKSLEKSIFLEENLLVADLLQFKAQSKLQCIVQQALLKKILTSLMFQCLMMTKKRGMLATEKLRKSKNLSKLRKQLSPLLQKKINNVTNQFKIADTKVL